MKKIFATIMCIAVIVLVGATQVTAATEGGGDVYDPCAGYGPYECFVSQPDGRYTVKVVKGPDGSFPVINGAGNSVFQYNLSMNCTEPKIDDILALFPACDPQLGIESVTGAVGYRINPPGVGDSTNGNGNGNGNCKTYFGTGQIMSQTFEWRKFNKSEGSFSVTLTGEVAASHGPMLLERTCSLNNWEYGEIKLPSCFEPPVGASTFEETVNFGLDTPDPNDDVSFKVQRRGDAKGCIKKLTACDRPNGDGNCVLVSPESLPANYVLRGALRGGMCGDEDVSVSHNSPFYLYDIVSGGVRYRMCLDLGYTSNPPTSARWTTPNYCGVGVQ